MEANRLRELDIMLADMREASALYQPTPFWQKAVDEIVGELRKEGVDGFKSLPSALKFFVPTYAYPGYCQDPDRYRPARDALAKIVPSPGKLDTRLLQLFSGRIMAFSDYRVFLASAKDGAPWTSESTESEKGAPLEQFEFDGKRYSRAFLNYLLGLNFLKSACAPGEIRSVMEIGGGFGALGEILLSDRRNDCFYIDVDIPPTGFVASSYLRSVFGDRVADYGATRDRETLAIDELRQRFDAAALCPWQLPKLTGTIDLFVNFISFQEMEPDVVQNYIGHVRRLAPRFVLLRNLREGKQVAKSPTDLGVKQPIFGTDYDRFLPEYALVAVNTTPYGFETEDGFHSELRLYRRSGAV